MHVFALTQPQTSHTAQITPRQRGQRAPVFHPSKVEDKRYTGDEDQVEEAHGGEEVSDLSQVGTAQEHLKQNLELDRSQYTNVKKLFRVSSY